MKWTNLILLFVLMGSAKHAAALEIETEHVRDGVAVLNLRGEFLPGDYEAFAREVVAANDTARVAFIHLNSPGGNLFEAEKIGNLVRDLGYTVYVEDDGVCASACFVVYALAMSRSALSGKVAIHRPYFNKKYYQEVSLSQSLVTHRLAIDEFRSILSRAGIPIDIIDLAVSRSSDDVHVLTEEELSRIGISPPWVEELLIGQCDYKAAQVREATFTRSLPYQERVEWMHHRSEAYSCLHDLYRESSYAALQRLRSEFVKPR